MYKFAPLKNLRRRHRIKLVTYAVLAAFAAMSAIGAVAAQAAPVTPASGSTTGSKSDCITPEQWAVARCVIMLGLMQEAMKPDYAPKDMQLAAPGRVVESTLSKPAEVSRWRPNPQSWIDAKSRVATTSGLTSQDISSTSRWAPKLLKGVGMVGWLGVGAEVAFAVRDGYLMPSLGIASDHVNKSFCTVERNIATDFMGGMAGATCPEWRLNKDFEHLVGDMRLSVSGSVAGLTYSHYYRPGDACYTGSSVGNVSIPKGTAVFGLKLNDQRGTPWVSLNGPCGKGYLGISADGGIKLVELATGKILESHTTTENQDAAQWVTKVECKDGTTRTAISEKYQQDKLGAVAQPESVQLDGCVPKKVTVGVKSDIHDIIPTDPWNPKPKPGEKMKPGTTDVIPTTQVPDEVQDWMTEFPQCWDGSCRLTLKKSTTTGTKLDCFDSPDECLDWYEEHKVDSTKYTCEYGGKVRPIADCLIYKNVFDRQKVQNCKAYSLPGFTVADECNNPGVQHVVNKLPVTNPETPQGDSKPRECFPSGWGVFNPFEWVFQPVKCALEWAFIPRESKIRATQMKLQLASVNSQPGLMVEKIGTWGSVVPAHDGCLGPRMNFELLGSSYDGHPLQACSGGLATAAATSKTVLTIVFILGGVFAVSRYVARIFGYGGLAEGSVSV